MNEPARFWALALALTGMVLSMSGCRQLEARDQLNKGVDAYTSARYEEAIEHFQKATELDPNLPMAKSYLAKALEQDIVPGVTTQENLKTAYRAIDIFKEVLDEKPDDVNSMKEIAGIYYNINDLDDAKIWQKKVLTVTPGCSDVSHPRPQGVQCDAAAEYTIGVIDWTEAHKNLLAALEPAGFNDDGKGNTKVPKKVMEPLKDEDSPLVDEALNYLNRAVEDQKNYDNAMVYLNLIYRSKANVDYGDDAAVNQDLAQAEYWSGQAMGARKANETKKNTGPEGITMGSGGGQQ